MKKIIKFLSLTLVEIILIVFLLIIIPSLLIREIREENNFGQNFFIKLDSAVTYQQEIKLTHPNIQNLFLLFKNPNLESKQLIYLTIEDINGNELRSLSFTGNSVEDPTWVPFKFQPLNEPKITLKINSPQAPNTPPLLLGFNEKDQSLIYQSSYQSSNFKENLIQNLNKIKEKTLISWQYSLIYLNLFLILNYLYIKNLKK
jgi:hypothetical protein